MAGFLEGVELPWGGSVTSGAFSHLIKVAFSHVIKVAFSQVIKTVFCVGL